MSTEREGGARERRGLMGWRQVYEDASILAQSSPLFCSAAATLRTPAGCSTICRAGLLSPRTPWSQAMRGEQGRRPEAAVLQGAVSVPLDGAMEVAWVLTAG